MAPRKVDYKAYLSDVQNAAMQFQALEEGLKIYLSVAFSVIQRGMKGRVHFSFTRADIERRSLGQLVRVFEKYNSNAELIAELKKLPEKRNFIAHQAYLLSAKQPIEEITKQIVKVRSAWARANLAAGKIVEEANKVLKLLDALAGEP